MKNSENTYDLANGLPILIKGEIKDTLVIVNPFSHLPAKNHSMNEREEKNLMDYLIKLAECGKVSVFCGSNERCSFKTQLSIQGDLHYAENKKCFRVLISEGTYCYFNLCDIVKVGTKKELFKDGSIAVIEIKF